MNPSLYKPGLSRDKTLVNQLKEFQLNPQSLVFVSLAEAYRVHGMLDQALEICEEGLEHHPYLSSARMLRARIFFDLKRFADCLEQLSEILKQNPENFRALKLRTEVFIHLGQKKRAYDALNHILVLFPQDKESVLALEKIENELVPIKQKISPTLIARVSSDFQASRGSIKDYRMAKLEEQYFAEPVVVPSALIGSSIESSSVVDQEEDPAFATKTIAELYLRQGLKKKAALVLRKMLQDNPSDEWALKVLQSIDDNALSAFSSPPKKVVLGGREKLQAKAQILERILAQVHKLKQA